MNSPDLAKLLPVNPGLTPLMLSHAAWVTHDVEATADFYMRVMGMELACTVLGASVPSTGDDFPYFHIFFRMADGSTIAFFEVPGLPQRSEVSHPAYEVFDHIALQAKDPSEVEHWYEWLVANDIEVIGPTDHNGLIYSIYFYDPNGIRLEITTPTDPDWNNHTARGKEHLAMWSQGKRDALEQNLDLSEAMVKLINTIVKH